MSCCISLFLSVAPERLSSASESSHVMRWPSITSSHRSKCAAKIRLHLLPQLASAEQDVVTASHQTRSCSQDLTGSHYLLLSIVQSAQPRSDRIPLLECSPTAEWTEHQDAVGDMYYVHKHTGSCVFDHPNDTKCTAQPIYLCLTFSFL